MYGGDLSLPNGLKLSDANNASSTYFQAGGTNRTTSVYIEPDIFGSAPSFTLNGGLLADSNVSLVADNFGAVTINQNGGTLTASNINLTGDMIIGDSSTMNRISNPGYFSLWHLLQIGNAAEQFGRFILAGDATIDLAGSASRLSFANSSAESWPGNTTLVVLNWNGTPSGGGTEQLGESRPTTAGQRFHRSRTLSESRFVP